jgi:hypothetical protein
VQIASCENKTVNTVRYLAVKFRSKPLSSRSNIRKKPFLVAEKKKNIFLFLRTLFDTASSASDVRMMLKLNPGLF